MPDFSTILNRWPRKLNPNYFAVIATADEMIESIFQGRNKVKKLKSADFSLFASFFFPNAAIDELKVLVLWSIWIFTWDDELDEPDGLHANNLESGNEVRKQTLLFVEQHLGLRASAEVPSTGNPIIDSFKIIGQQFRSAYSVEQCQLIFDELKLSMQISGKEQEIRLSDDIPTPEEYWIIRAGSGGVGLELSAIEFSYKLRGPPNTTLSPLLKYLWDEANIVIWMTNDILSMRKKICGDLQKAVDTAHTALLAAIDRFEAAAGDFLSQTKAHTIFQIEAKVLVEGLRDTWVGDIYWHFESGRYGLQNVKSENGRFSVTL